MDNIRKTIRRMMLTEETLRAGERQKINAALVKAGLDGNKRFQSPGAAANVIGEVLTSFGIEQADLFSAYGDEGRVTLDLARSNTADPFSPADIGNSMLVITWHKFESGNYEVIAYLS